MNLKDIEQRVAELDTSPGSEFLFDLLRAYGIPKASISASAPAPTTSPTREDEYLWRGKVYYRSLDCDDEELYAAVDAAKAEERILRERPRFAIVRNETRLVAADLDTGDALDIEIDELQNHAAFFLPWAGIEKTQIENLNLADVKAAEKMAKLYDEIVKHNAVETEEQIHDLNVFFSRLLFCFFAEDTGVFEEGSFTNAVGSLSLEDGKDLHELLDQFFDVLNTKPESREPATRRTCSSSGMSTASSSSDTQARRGSPAKARVHRPRLRNARLVPDQPGHLRLDDPGRRPSRPAGDARDALHVA